MDLAGEHGDHDRYNMQRSLEEEEETDSGQEEDKEVETNSADIGEEIPFLQPEDFSKGQHQSLVHTDPKAFASPTEAPAPTEPPAPIEPPPPPPPVEEGPPYPETNATITDLAKQELGNWMSGGPKESEEQGEKNNQNEGAEPPGNNEDDAEDNTQDEAGDSYADPSEMDIVVPDTEEEEEAIDEEIEEWEEEHGKPKPGEEAPADDDEEEGGEMDIPQTEEEEEKVNEEIEEWEENNGKPKPDAEAEQEEENASSKDEEEGNEDEDDDYEEPSESDSDDDDDDDEEEEETEDIEEEPIETETESSVPDPASSPSLNPLVVTPSWTPPDIEQKHTLKPAPVPTMVLTHEPTVAPVPKPTAFATPTGSTVVANQSDDLGCQEYGSQTAAYLLCKNNIPPMAGSAVGLGIPLLIILCCCWRYCCGKSKKDTNSRGEYRQIANTYGDASFDNAFSEDISDDEEDLEDAAWGESNGRRVLEMKNMGRRKGDDDLSLEEMNG